MIKNITSVVVFILLGFNPLILFATEVGGGTSLVQERLTKLYPATKFESIKLSVIPGLYEVVMGKNIAYVDESGRYFVFGRIFDMAKQEDLTDRAARATSKIPFIELPLDNAIKTTRGNGNRTLAVFTDPDCPYCKQLEKEMTRLTDVTIYTFLYPIVGLHPDAKNKAISVWCADDKNDAWEKLMISGQMPNNKMCNHPVDKNIALAQKFGINGTPTLVNKLGQLMQGMTGVEQLEIFISTKD